MSARWRLGEGLNGWRPAPWRPSSPLWLQVLGPLTLGGIPLRGHRRQAFLVALLEARASGREGLDVLDLLDLLYPGQDEAKAFGALRELVFVLRRRFGVQVIGRKGALYVLGPGVASDLEVFLQHPRSWLWRGRYLNGLGTDQVLWARVYRLALDVAQQAEPLEAARLFSWLLLEEPYDQEVLALLLRLLGASGAFGSLERVYFMARRRFREVGLILPSTPSEFLQGL